MRFNMKADLRPKTTRFREGKDIMQDTGTINLKKVSLPDEIVKHQMNSKNMLLKQELDKKRIEKSNILIKKEKTTKRLNITNNKTK